MAAADDSAAWTAVESVARVVERVRAAFNSGRTRPIDFRLRQLRQLRAFFVEREAEIVAALEADLRKTYLQTMLTEVNGCVDDIDEHLARLPDWSKPRALSVPAAQRPAAACTVPEPFGVVLVVGPWNYPLRTLLLPLVGVIAAGNAAVLKPSEVAPQTAALIARRLPEYLDAEAFAVVQGGVPQASELLRQRFDYIVYTGNSEVGRIVMREAAKFLTPVTLELGGKSPAIVDSSCDLAVTARRLVWAKFLNAGQTCVAPDYVLVQRDIERALIERLQRTIVEFYGDDPQKSPDYTRIINERHLRRLESYLSGQQIVHGGRVDAADRYIAPTLISNPKPDDLIMREEIFGPLLVIIGVDSTQAAIEFVNAREKPLALYIFAGDKALVRRVIDSTSSGGVCVNDAIMQSACSTLPFGGVGNSGMGAYNAKYSFDSFSHMKPVLDRATYLDPSLRYPPYTPSKQKWFLALTRPLPSVPNWLLFSAAAVLVGAAATYFYSAK